MRLTKHKNQKQLNVPNNKTFDKANQNIKNEIQIESDQLDKNEIGFQVYDPAEYNLTRIVVYYQS